MSSLTTKTKMIRPSFASSSPLLSHQVARSNCEHSLSRASPVPSRAQATEATTFLSGNGILSSVYTKKQGFVEPKKVAGIATNTTRPPNTTQTLEPIRSTSLSPTATSSARQVHNSPRKNTQSVQSPHIHSHKKTSTILHGLPTSTTASLCGSLRQTVMSHSKNAKL